MRTKHEYEANAFAAHVIIDDDDLIDYMRQGYDVLQLSRAMNTNIKGKDTSRKTEKTRLADAPYQV